MPNSRLTAVLSVADASSEVVCGAAIAIGAMGDGGNVSERDLGEGEKATAGERRRESWARGEYCERVEER